MAAMPTALPREDRAKLDQIIRKTRTCVDDALIAHAETGKITPEHRACLRRVGDDTSSLLARFLDGSHYNAVPWRTIKLLWDYGQMAADLLEAHPMYTDAKDITEKLKPGRYRVTRTLTDSAGVIVSVKAIECNNPAFGFVQLDAWQDSLPLQPARPTAAAA